MSVLTCDANTRLIRSRKRRRHGGQAPAGGLHAAVARRGEEGLVGSTHCIQMSRREGAARRLQQQVYESSAHSKVEGGLKLRATV